MGARKTGYPVNDVNRFEPALPRYQFSGTGSGCTLLQTSVHPNSDHRRLKDLVHAWDVLFKILVALTFCSIKHVHVEALLTGSTDGGIYEFQQAHIVA